MTLEEFYDKIGGDYQDVIDRILKPEKIVKYLGMFKQDDNYGRLCEGIKMKDYKTAFEASHNLKGTCLNLGFTQLCGAASDICEACRHGEPSDDIDIDAMIKKVTQEYEKTCSLIDEVSM